uniref:Ig-like domain-containing protein n=1 Tax=Myripristis murdjan TaxID=586833 RepID=A0A667ZPL6_9TELE
MFCGCYQSGVAQVHFQWDRDEVGRIDFEKKGVVWTAPMPAVMEDLWSYWYDEGRYVRNSVCKLYLPIAVMEDHRPTDAKAPVTVIYPRHEAKLGVANTLFCYVSHFYPPAINITWTRDGVKLIEGVALSDLSPEEDGTFSQLASLSFSPETGAVLGCTVEHQNLSSPAFRTWVNQVSFGSAAVVLCGVGVTLGIICLTVGVVLFLKAPKPTSDLRSAAYRRHGSQPNTM